MRKVNVGVIGCGMISDIYLKNCTQTFAQDVPILNVVACADIVPELAQRKASEYNVPLACTVDELLAHPDVELVLDLTIPTAHPDVNTRALRAGKHVYTEKPFALTHEDANQVLDVAREQNLRIGSAPDTFLGAGLQTCRKLVDDGAIGIPYGASGLILMGNGSGGAHPRIADYFQIGWDPLFDMAPYYLTALIFLLGPIRRVSGSTGNVFREFTVTHPDSPRFGETIPVNAPLHASATLDFEGGTIATLQTAKESFGYTPRLEIYGTEGILYVPDPNMFGGPIQIKGKDGTLSDIPYSHGYSENSRGIGIADMAFAIRNNRPHRASGELARHVNDVTLSIFESSRTDRHIAIATRCEQPAPLPGLPSNQIDQ